MLIDKIVFLSSMKKADGEQSGVRAGEGVARVRCSKLKRNKQEG